jgi:hypothetical protein
MTRALLTRLALSLSVLIGAEGACRSETVDVKYRGPVDLLRPCRNRPCGRNDNSLDEFAPPHSITSSARERRVEGIVRPRALAVERLMTSSNLVGCSTGISPGLVPRRILST